MKSFTLIEVLALISLILMGIIIQQGNQGNEQLQLLVDYLSESQITIQYE